jgi:predicted TPR repeat methyltransferase
MSGRIWASPSIELREQPDTWLLLGMARRRLADAAGSEAAYRVALAIAPRSIAAWQCLGVLKEEQRDHPAAIECFETCLKLGEGTPAVSANLGRLYAQTGRLIDAHDAYDSAARREPSNAHYVTMTTQMRFFRDVLLGAPVHDALRAYSAGAGAPLPAGESRADAELSWLDKAGAQMASFGLIEGATRVVLHRLERGHATPTATYLLQALRKDPALDRCPSDYIVESFNAFAGDFDAKLVGELGYRLPETIDELLRSAHITGPLPNVLDAGCGTGLCGRFLRPLAVRLEGVDLSPRMLDKARLLALYDRLECSDLVAFLVASPTPYDLVVAADVLIYLGDLRPLFAAAARAIAPGGWFLGSIEALDGRGYGVLPSGRFAHAPSYVRDVAARAFVEITCIETGLRLEGPERVRGAVFLWRRVGAGDPLPA